MSSITVTTSPVETVDALFRHYPGQYHAQDAYLAVDLETGQMWCSYNAEIGNGIPESVFHRRTVRVSIPTLTADAANALMERATPLAQRLVDGATIEWDGHNHVGRLDADADAAYDELMEMCDPQSAGWSDQETVSEWDAGDWFGGEGRDAMVARLGLTADTTDEQLAAMADAEQAEAAGASPAGHVILSGAEAHLREVRDDLRSLTYDSVDDDAHAMGPAA